MTKDILYLLWFLRLTQSERSKKSQFPKLEQFFLSNFSTFAWKMLIFMGYLWFNKYAYLFLFQKGAKIQNFCLFARYTNIFIFHLNLIHKRASGSKPVDFIYQSFRVKLYCSKTGVGGIPFWLAVVILLSYCTWCSPYFVCVLKYILGVLKYISLLLKYILRIKE